MHKGIHTPFSVIVINMLLLTQFLIPRNMHPDRTHGPKPIWARH
jgi:hypothetical protein